MKKLFILVTLLFSLSAFADCEEHTPYGYPETPVPTTLLCRKPYLVEHFDECKVPMVVVEHLTSNHIGGNEGRDVFKADPDLPAGSKAVPSDYINSGYDKGHMAPAGDMMTDSDSMFQSFYLSNAVPQAPKNNRGPWRMLEIRARALAVKLGEVYVFTGAIFDKNPSKIGSGVCVPTTLFKVIIDPKIQQSIAYLMPNTNDVAKQKFDDFVTTVSKVEAASGINFTPKLNSDVAVKLKTSIGPSLTGR